MKQSRFASLMESIGNTLSGFAISLVAQWFFLPLLGVSITLSQNFLFAIIMTFVSVARGFAWRRLMEALHVRVKLSPFMQAVIAERGRQVDVEGWDAEHDDKHPKGELAAAGAAYALTLRPVTYRDPKTHHHGLLQPRGLWPWSDWFKPKEPRRNLVRAAALIIAEGERHDRLGRRSPGAEVPPADDPPPRRDVERDARLSARGLAPDVHEWVTRETEGRER